MKIVQITGTNYDVYGLDEQGNLYVHKTMAGGTPEWRLKITN